MRLYVCVVHGVAVLVKCINASHTIDKVTCLFNMLQMCTRLDWADTFYLLINQNHKYADNSVSVWTKRKRIAHFIHRFHLTNNFVLILVFGTRAATLSVAIGKTVEHRQMMWSELFDFFVVVVHIMIENQFHVSHIKLNISLSKSPTSVAVPTKSEHFSNNFGWKLGAFTAH